LNGRGRGEGRPIVGGSSRLLNGGEKNCRGKEGEGGERGE